MTKPYISVDLRGLRKVTENSNFIIAGAGQQAVRILRFLRPRYPKYITDINPDKWGLGISGCKVVSPSYFQSHGCEVVVCTSLNYFIIARQLNMRKGEGVLILPPVEIIYGTSF
jgi:hypothetical protein